MIPESTVHITDKTLSSASGLREGSFVFVRVIGERHAGSYEVSFAGRRFFVSSDKVLNPGDAFPARLSVKGRTLILIPDYERIFNKSRIINNSNITNISELSNEAMDSFFSAMGLSVDDVSRRIVSFMQLSGLRISPDKAAFYRDIARRFPGHEGQAAEAAVLLDEKGIPVTEENIEKLIGLVLGWCAPEGDFTEKMNLKDDEPYWLVIPYDYKGQEPFSGSVCLLKDPVSNTVSRIRMTARKGEVLFFVKINLNYGINKNKINRCDVAFCMNGAKVNGSRAAERLRRFLSGIASEIDVRYDESPDCLYLSDDDDIALARTEA